MFPQAPHVQFDMWLGRVDPWCASKSRLLRLTAAVAPSKGAFRRMLRASALRRRARVCQDGLARGVAHDPQAGARALGA